MSLRKCQQVARQILIYLDRHPNAADTLEGIARWWIREQAIWIGVSEVNEALVWLVKRRRLLVHPTARGPSYRLNTLKTDRKSL